jgi:hypothetical protein
MCYLVCYYMNDVIHATSLEYPVPMFLEPGSFTKNSSGENWKTGVIALVLLHCYYFYCSCSPLVSLKILINRCG